MNNKHSTVTITTTKALPSTTAFAQQPTHLYDHVVTSYSEYKQQRNEATTITTMK